MWSKISSSKLFYAVLALICAIGCWLYVDIVQEPNTTVTIRNIPISFVGEDVLAEQGLMITDIQNTTVSLTLTGTRTALSQLTRSNITITVQAAYQISEEGSYSLDYSVSFPSSLGSKVTVKSSSVSKIGVTVVQMTSATVDILGSFEGTAVDGAIIDENGFLFEISTVTVSGERSLVEQVDHALVTLSENDLAASWSGMLDIVLVDGEGNTVDMSSLTCSITEVYTTFPIYLVKEVPLTVEFTEGGGATVENVTCQFVGSETITISGTQETLDEIDSICVGTVNLSEVITSDRLSFTIPVPDGVTIVSGVTTATVTVSISGLATRVVQTENIRFINLPEGLDADPITESISVRIRGAEEIMELVMDEDIVVTVDLSDINESYIGSSWYFNATVSVTGFSEVGAVGDYQIAATILVAEETDEAEEATDLTDLYQYD